MFSENRISRSERHSDHFGTPADAPQSQTGNKNVSPENTERRGKTESD